MLEATGRPGGRIQTDRKTGVECGARLVHDARLLPLLARHGIETRPFDETSGVYLHRQNDTGMERDETGKFAVVTLIEDLRAQIRQLTRFPPMSVETFVESELRHRDLGLSKRMSTKREVVFSAIRAEYGADPAALSIHSLLETSSYDGQNHLVPGGFSDLPERMAVGRDIRYGSPVSRVVRTADGVELHGDKGAPVRTRNVVVTAPLGVVQSGKIAFESGLPSEMDEAIQQLGNAIVCELIYVFDKTYWNDDVTLIRTDIPEAPLWWPNGTNPPALTCYVGGQPAWRLQKDMTEDEALRAGRGHLERILGSEPMKHIVSQWREPWNRKKWKRTAYSFRQPRYEGARKVMEEIIDGRLAFAGEAYIDDDSASTVYGAIRSGQEAVRRLIAG